jgi:GNAT superfamily N-acetyltransferase
MTAKTESADKAIIRPASDADWPAIVAMRNDLNAHELEGCPHASIQKLTLEQFKAHWGSTMADPDYCWRIVEADGRPIGFGLLYVQKPKVAPLGGFVHWAYLAPGERRQGRGELLMEHLLQWAREKNVQRVELQFIDGNQSAERFWHKMGFRPYARKCVKSLD